MINSRTIKIKERKEKKSHRALILSVSFWCIVRYFKFTGTSIPSSPKDTGTLAWAGRSDKEVPRAELFR